MREFSCIPFGTMCMPGGREKEKGLKSPAGLNTEVRMMNIAVPGMTWKETFDNLMNDFMAWGCPYSRRKLPEIALGYDCTPLFFWNWMDDPETSRTEKGFLRVLGYAWRKYLEEETEPAPVDRIPARAVAGSGKAA